MQNKNLIIKSFRYSFLFKLSSCLILILGIIIFISSSSIYIKYSEKNEKARIFERYIYFEDVEDLNYDFKKLMFEMSSSDYNKHSLEKTLKILEDIKNLNKDYQAKFLIHYKDLCKDLYKNFESNFNNLGIENDDQCVYELLEYWNFGRSVYDGSSMDWDKDGNFDYSEFSDFLIRQFNILENESKPCFERFNVKMSKDYFGYYSKLEELVERLNSNAISVEWDIKRFNRFN